LLARSTIHCYGQKNPIILLLIFLPAWVKIMVDSVVTESAMSLGGGTDEPAIG
jgi:hypothetical protein